MFGSSLSTYGTYAADDVVSETHRSAPEDIYGAAKLYDARIRRVHLLNELGGPGAQRDDYAPRGFSRHGLGHLALRECPRYRLAQ